MQQAKRVIYSTIAGVIIPAILCGCSLVTGGAGSRDKSHVFIDETITEITDALCSRDADKIFSLCGGDLRSDYVRSELERFTSGCGPVKNVYVDYGGYAHSKGKDGGRKYEKIQNLTGVLVTGDNMYEFLVDYTQYDKKSIEIDRLWIITGKTEAEENAEWNAKYHFGKTETFKYADYFDEEFDGEYRLIWGEILKWNDDSAFLEESQFDNSDLNSIALEDILAKYGQYGAVFDTGSGYHILFYKTSEEGKYTQIFLNDDDTAGKVQSTDNIGYGITGIKEVK